MTTGSTGQRADAGGGVPDVVIVNAKVYTGDPARPDAEAVAIEGERIGRVGSTAQIRGLAGGSDARRSTRGPPRRARVQRRPRAPARRRRGCCLAWTCARAVGEADVAHRLGAYAATLAKRRWITGGYWDHERWPGAALPTRGRSMPPCRTTRCSSRRLDGHMAVANSPGAAACRRDAWHARA